VRPGGRAVSVLNSRHGLEWRRDLVRAKPGPARPEGTARHHKRTARGVRQRRASLLRHLDIDIRHGGGTLPQPAPAHPLGWRSPFRPSRREPAGILVRGPRPAPSPLAGEGWGEGSRDAAASSVRYEPTMPGSVTPHPALRATFSRKGRRGALPHRLRRRPARDPPREDAATEESALERAIAVQAAAAEAGGFADRVETRYRLAVRP